MNYRTIVRDNIRGYRNKNGWTQEKLAMRANLSNDYISRVELGKEGITVDNLAKIAKALKTEPYLFFQKDSYKSE